jgi:ElaB/YqjD/DUF883 family membrane-anchored ribosome-binding protein
MDEATSAQSTEQVRGLGNDMSDATTQAVNQARRAQHGFKQVGSNFKHALDQSRVDQPLTTVALAAVVGFALGVLWKA